MDPDAPPRTRIKSNRDKVPHPDKILFESSRGSHSPVLTPTSCEAGVPFYTTSGPDFVEIASLITRSSSDL